MEVSGQLHALATLPLVTQWIGGWVGPRAGLDMVVKRRKSCHCPHPETQRGK